MQERQTTFIVTLGPATNTEYDLKMLKDKGVNFVRVNMSHSSLEDLEYFIQMAKRVGIPFIIDTEGSQIRTGDLEEECIEFHENDEVKLYAKPIRGNKSQLSLKPGHVIEQLEVGDLIHVDFDTLILRISDISTAAQGYITARTKTGGKIGRNKAVVVDPIFDTKFRLPPLSEKDHKAIALGLKEGIEHIAVSFVRSGESIDEVRRVTQDSMKIISKVECVDALESIEEICEKTDFILIDRGDLSKEIPLEKIPFTQKVIIHKAGRYGTPVFVATNLLETMVEKRRPTRAEAQDVINTILDGAQGLTLSAETAIGKHPMECVNVLNNLVLHAESILARLGRESLRNRFVEELEASDYLLETSSSSLVPPHGGTLINRFLSTPPTPDYLASLPKVQLSANQQMDVEQIAFGTYSPLQGFMGEQDFHSVLDHMRLASGLVWPLPIVLDVSEERAASLEPGAVIGLTDEKGDTLALLTLREKYRFDAGEMALKLFGTCSEEHPGVKMVNAMKPVLLGGEIDLIKGRQSDTRAYELTPRQMRRLFEDRGWSRVLGFHTRNAPHMVHEFMQLEALKNENCDGLLVQPVVGSKKPGDFKSQYIIKTYEKMMESFYPRDKVVFSAFSTFSRYAGPREALFTALCRKNFGCCHFVVGRDHTGVGKYYDPYASHKIFDQFPDIGIKIVKFHEIFFSKKLHTYIQSSSLPHPGEDDLINLISGTEARVTLLQNKQPPSWYMRPEISDIILRAIKSGEEVFET